MCEVMRRVLNPQLYFNKINLQDFQIQEKKEEKQKGLQTMDKMNKPSTSLQTKNQKLDKKRTDK